MSPPALPETICQEADRLVSHDRHDQYGHPADNFADTARGWEVVLKLPTGSIRPEQVALCMAWLKIARESHRPKRDNRVDCCGYLKTADMIHERGHQD
jgi:hypothetical protein